MQPTSEKWEVVVGKQKYIVSQEEREMILNAGEARFVKFRDLVINPAFVQSMRLVYKYNPNQIEAPDKYADTLPPEEAQKRMAKIRAELGLTI